jgi:hypothetical protein
MQLKIAGLAGDDENPQSWFETRSAELAQIEERETRNLGHELKAWGFRRKGK